MSTVARWKTAFVLVLLVVLSGTVMGKVPQAFDPDADADDDVYVTDEVHRAVRDLVEGRNALFERATAEGAANDRRLLFYSVFKWSLLGYLSLRPELADGDVCTFSLIRAVRAKLAFGEARLRFLLPHRLRVPPSSQIEALTRAVAALEEPLVQPLQHKYFRDYPSFEPKQRLEAVEKVKDVLLPALDKALYDLWRALIEQTTLLQDYDGPAPVVPVEDGDDTRAITTADVKNG